MENKCLVMIKDGKEPELLNTLCAVEKSKGAPDDWKCIRCVYYTRSDSGAFLAMASFGVT